VIGRLAVAAALLIAAPAFGQTAPAPSAEAEALGRQVAEDGAFAGLLGVMSDREIGELVDAHPELDAAGKAKLRESAAATLRRVDDRVFAVLGRHYAASMSIDDLRATAGFLQSPAAKAWRAAEPGAMIEVAKALDGFDFKKQVWADFCATPGALCKPAKAK